MMFLSAVHTHDNGVPGAGCHNSRSDGEELFLHVMSIAGLTWGYSKNRAGPISVHVYKSIPVNQLSKEQHPG